MISRLVVFACLLAAALTPAQAGVGVFVNELHYDNSGPDSDEMVEIAGPALTDLDGWSVVFYNGTGGASYLTVPLSGILSNQCDGFGTLAVPAVGLQNGSPDGLALVDGTTVVQFLSYEGSFTASNGPAAGMTSVDIGVSENGSAPAGQSLRLGGTGNDYGDFAWQSSSAASFGQCNPGQTFTGGVDSAPIVIALQPADGSTNVPESALIDVRFSEAVTLGPGAVTLVCSTSGSVGLTLTSNPDAARYIYTPAATFASAETCTTTIAASLVSDVDGTPQTMTANATSTFTVATDVAPTVVDRRPLAGATDVPTLSPLRVFFDEAVGVTDGWITLSCTASGAHALAVSGGPQRYTAQPSPALGGGETCTATVHAAHVVDLDGTPTAMTADASWSFVTGEAVGNYYASANTGSAAALRASLHAIIDDHVRFPYSSSGTDTWTILEQADEDPEDPYRILDVYKNVSYAKVETNRPYNREHIWPKAYGFPDDVASNYAYTDTHMLHLTDNTYNGTRGTKPFGTCSAVCNEYTTELTNGQGGGSGVYPGNSNWSDGVIWEVWNTKKGDLARALLYMDVRYEGGTNGVSGAAEPDLVLTDDPSLIQITGGNTTGTAYMGMLSVILAWHYADPPTDRERLRNEIIFGYQRNRNPFVDHPEWADCIFLDLCVSDRVFANGFEP
ncbi:MAG TPA: endonuclease [Tahibacter sp.]|uniref:endonuclease n=1 Tax=Tahibacter sp. TaxID=2056211 RepID=UPI002C38FC7D|nr:endonuclease [Tahibacter sp.]HSX60633.1 endonuclease [Tahibacter sp.]